MRPAHARPLGCTLVLCLALLILASTPGAAQEIGPFELSGGYTFLSSSEIVDGHAAGWVVGGAWNAASWLALGVDLSRNTQQQDVGLLQVDARFLSFHAGPRFFIPIGRIRSFAHLLVGRTDVDLQLQSALPPTSVGDAFEQDFSWQIGGGVDIAVDQGFALRLAFDHRRVEASAPFTQQRILTAVVYAFP